MVEKFYDLTLRERCRSGTRTTDDFFLDSSCLLHFRGGNVEAIRIDHKHVSPSNKHKSPAHFRGSGTASLGKRDTGHHGWNEATRITARAIQVDPGSLGVACAAGNAKIRDAQNEQKPAPELGHEPELLHDPKQRLLRQALGLRLALIIRPQPPMVCISRLHPEGNRSSCCVGGELCLFHALAFRDAGRGFSYSNGDAKLEAIKLTKPTRFAKDSQLRGAWLG